jgi:hypothetical protein
MCVSFFIVCFTLICFALRVLSQSLQSGQASIRDIAEVINRWQAAHGSDHKLVHSLISGDAVHLASSLQVHNFAHGSDISCVSVFQPGPFSWNTHDFGSEPESEGGSGHESMEGIFVDSDDGKQFIFKYDHLFEAYETRFSYDVLPWGSFHVVRIQFTLVQVLPGHRANWMRSDASPMVVGTVYYGHLKVDTDNHADIVLRIPGVCQISLYTPAASVRVKREIEHCRRQRTQEFVAETFDTFHMPRPNIKTCQRLECLRSFKPPRNNERASHCCRQCRSGRGCDQRCVRRCVRRV